MSTEMVKVPREEFDRLTERVAELENELEAVNDRMVSRSSINVVLDQLLGEQAVEDFTADPAQARDAAAELNRDVQRALGASEEANTRLDAVEDNGKNGKVASIATYAAKKKNGKPVVLLSPDEIQGAAGVSKRYAYDLIDDLPEQYPWLHRRKDLKQYGDLERDTDARKRALAVDIEGVQGPAAPLNKFNNGHGGEGGE